MKLKLREADLRKLLAEFAVDSLWQYERRISGMVSAMPESLGSVCNVAAEFVF
jgi:hypothetical protein